MCAYHGGKLLTIENKADFQFIRAYGSLNGLGNIAIGINMTTNISSR